MQRFTYPIAMLLLLPILASSTSAQEKDLEKISGTWILESGELGGKKLPQEFIASVSLIISGTSYSTKVGTLTDKGNLIFVYIRLSAKLDVCGWWVRLTIDGC